MKNAIFALWATVAVSSALAQSFTNVNYENVFGDLSEVSVPYSPSKSVKDGNYIYHVTYSSSTSIGNHIMVRKDHVDGTHSWSGTYGDIGPLTKNHGVDIKVDASGNVYVVGATEHLTEGYNVLAVKFNSSGIKQWDYSYHSTGSTNEYATALDLDGSGNLYVTGQIESVTDDVLALKISSAGSFAWAQTYDYDSGEDGGIYVEYVDVNEVNFFAITGDDAFLLELSKITYNSTGLQTSANRTSLGYGNVMIHSFKPLSSGYAACGYYETGSGDLNGAIYNFSSTLSTNWSYAYDAAGYNDEFIDFTVDASGNFYVTGSQENAAGLPSIVAVKLNSLGTQLWAKNMAFPNEVYSVGRAVSTDGTNVLISSSVENMDEELDLYNLVVACSDGEMLWHHFYDDNDGDDLALDNYFIDNDEFVVTGSTIGDRNYSLGLEFFVDDVTLVNKPNRGKYADQQIIVAFKDNVLAGTAKDNRNVQFGELGDFFSSATVTDITNGFGVGDLSGVTVTKIFPHLTSTDTKLTAKDGTQFDIPPLWGTFCLHFTDSIDEDTVTYWGDSLLGTQIRYIEKNAGGFESSWLPKDPLFEDGEQRGFEESLVGDGYLGVNLPLAWNTVKGSPDIKVGVFDSGVRWSHEDFTSSDGIPTLSESVFYDGYDGIDDVPLNLSARDYVDNEGFGHGTLVAGIIGAKTNNFDNDKLDFVGVAGVAGGNVNGSSPGVSIASIGFVNDVTRENVANSTLALQIEMSYDPNGYDLDVMNNSWFMDTKYRLKKYLNEEKEDIHLIREQMWLAAKAGVIVVAASANLHDDEQYYPSSFFEPGMIKVGAYDEDRARADFSCYGGNLDLMAPGVSELLSSTSKGMDYFIASEDASTEGLDGTSFATPVVSGVSALMLEYWNDNAATYSDADVLYPEDIEWLLEQSATDLTFNEDNDAVVGYDEETGWGQLDAAKALDLIKKENHRIFHYATTVTLDPSSVSASPADEKVCVKNNFEKVCYKKNYRVDFYKVSATITGDWPVGFDLVTSSSSGVSVQENGWWPVHTRSELWGYDAAEDDFWPYSGLTFSSAPQKVNIGGVDKLQATVEGYMVFVDKKAWGSNIDEWYPFDPKNGAASINMEFSAYFIKSNLNSVSERNKDNGLLLYPNPTQSSVLIRSYYGSPLSECQLYDMAGRPVNLDMTHNGASEYRLNLGTLPKGVYIFRAQTENGMVSKRIVKE